MSEKDKIHAWIVKHLSKTDVLPKPVDQLTDDEAKIFKIAVQHHSFLIFLREWLAGNPSFETSIDDPKPEAKAYPEPTALEEDDDNCGGFF